MSGRSFVRHRYMAFSPFSSFPLLSLVHSLSFLSALGVPFPVSRTRNTPDLLAAQIKIEQSTIKCKWGYWPKPLRPVIDFHGAAPRFSTSRSRDLYYFCFRSRILRSALYAALITSTSPPDRRGSTSRGVIDRTALRSSLDSISRKIHATCDRYLLLFFRTKLGLR